MHKGKKYLKDLTYADYGLNKAQTAEVINYCRTTDVDGFQDIYCIALDVAPGLEDQICNNLRFGFSFEAMDEHEQIPVTKITFYALRKKVISEIYHQYFG